MMRHLFWAKKEREAKKRQASTTAVRKKDPPVKSNDSEGQRTPAAKPRLISPCYTCSEWGHLGHLAQRIVNCMYLFVQPVLSAGLVDLCNVSNEVLCRSVKNVCRKVTEVPPFGGKQLFNNKVEKVSEVTTDDSLFVC